MARKTKTKTVFAWNEKGVAYKFIRVPVDDRFDIVSAKAVAKLFKELCLPVDSQQWQVIDGRAFFYRVFR